MVTRYDVDGYLHAVDGGEYVDYEDYERDLAAAQQEIARLRAALEAESLRLDWLQGVSGNFYNLDRVTSIVGKGFSSEQGVWHASLRDNIDRQLLK